MASRTYREEEVGPQSTNRFVVPRTFPTTVVTGATTKAASAQPNLTGKRKVVEPQDSASSPTPEPTPIDIAGLSDKELTTMGKSGFPGGWMSPGSIISGVVPGGTVVRGINVYEARKEIMARLTTPGLREGDEEYMPSQPMSSKETSQQMKEINQRKTLQDRGYGDGEDAVGAHPDADDLGPDSGQGDTEATWGG
jgi:hypothetical protein